MRTLDSNLEYGGAQGNAQAEDIGVDYLLISSYCALSEPVPSALCRDYVSCTMYRLILVLWLGS